MKTYLRLALVGLTLVCGGCTSIYTIPAGSAAGEKPVSTSSPYNPPSQDARHSDSQGH